MSSTPPPRLVTLVLVDADGRLLGALPPFEAETPWWMDAGPLVRAAHATHDLRVTVLRLLDSQRPSAHGGAVTYLAQLDRGAAATDLRPWSGPLPEHPLRHAYARVGGPQADLAWAVDLLRSRGESLTGAPEQIRTWNLSSLWRLPSTAGQVWLKVVPPFFAHEGALLAALEGAAVPRLLGRQDARVLLAEVAGEDLHEATLAERRAMVDLLVGLQGNWLGRADELLALGLPDWRAPALCAAIEALVERRAEAIAPADRTLLATFVAGLPERFAAIASCGLPDGLVHGDFHSGNLRGGNGQPLTLLDWADSGVGHALLDQPAFLGRTPPEQAGPVQLHWCAAWQTAIPGCDPARAARLLAPVAAVRQALIYQRFLDRIEPAEHPYHRVDVPDWLRRTADRLRCAAPD